MEAGTQAVGATPGASALGVRRRRRGEEVIRVLLFLAAAISVLTTILIVVALLKESIPFFQDVGSASSPTASGRRCSTTRSSASGRCSSAPS